MLANPVLLHARQKEYVGITLYKISRGVFLELAEALAEPSDCQTRLEDLKKRWQGAPGYRKASIQQKTQPSC
jgi:hypothetical protein